MENTDLTNEVAYFTRIAQFRYEISRLMSNHLLIDDIDASDGMLDSYYGRTSKNLKAGVAVEFLNDVIPYCIYTHLGSFKINPHVSKQTLELTYSFLTEEEKINFVRDFKQKFGVTTLQPYWATEEGNVIQPVIYHLGKLPNETNVQNELCQILPTPTTLQPQQVDAEQSRWQQIRGEVDDRLRFTNHPEMTFVDAKISKRKSLIVQIKPKLPEYLENKVKSRG